MKRDTMLISILVISRAALTSEATYLVPAHEWLYLRYLLVKIKYKISKISLDLKNSKMKTCFRPF